MEICSYCAGRGKDSVCNPCYHCEGSGTVDDVFEGNDELEDPYLDDDTDDR